MAFGQGLCRAGIGLVVQPEPPAAGHEEPGRSDLTAIADGGEAGTHLNSTHRNLPERRRRMTKSDENLSSRPTAPAVLRRLALKANGLSGADI
jgi:hypothetical protein